MIGDDVVDLHDPAIEAHHLRERFLDRVLAADERAVFARARSPEAAKALLWSFFAAKEAAYKVVSKIASASAPVFAHRKFILAENSRSIRYEGRVLSVDLEVTTDFAHAVARDLGDGAGANRVVERGVRRVDTGSDLSRAARAFLCEAVARRLGCRVGSLTIHRPPRPGSWDGFGPPKLLRDGAAIDVDVSLSHDGRFVSFAFEA